MNKGNSVWKIFVFLFIFSIFTDLFEFIPLFLMGYGIYSLIKHAKRNTETGQNISRNNRNPRVNRNRRTGSQYTFTNQDRQSIQEAMEIYFSANDRLKINDTITLRPVRGEFTNIRDLNVYQGEDCIATMNDFKNAYPDMYDGVMNLLLEFAKYQQREAVKQTTATMQQQAKKAAKAEEQVQKKTLQNEYDNAKDYIERINGLNQEIPQEEITNGLYQMVSYLKQFELIEQNFPQKKKEMTKVYHYYLPIIIGILENYKQFQNSAQSTEEFQRSEEKLIKTIVLVNGALKKMTAELCEDELLNLNANMSTLEALLQKDGLVEEPLRATKKG